MFIKIISLKKNTLMEGKIKIIDGVKWLYIVQDAAGHHTKMIKIEEEKEEIKQARKERKSKKKLD